MRKKPSKLYKYRDVSEYTENIFKNNELFFSNPLKFNDPFDSAFHVDCTDAERLQILSSNAFQTVRKANPELPLEEALKAALARQSMSQSILIVERVIADESGHIALQVVPPGDVDLQFIYRAAI